jgi:hypothetical protein
MAVTVTLVSPAAQPSPQSPVEHPTGTMVDVDFDHLYVYASPDVVVATYSKGQWLSAVVS